MPASAASRAQVRHSASAATMWTTLPPAGSAACLRPLPQNRPGPTALRQHRPTSGPSTSSAGPLPCSSRQPATARVRPRRPRLQQLQRLAGLAGQLQRSGRRPHPMAQRRASHTPAPGRPKSATLAARWPSPPPPPEAARSGLWLASPRPRRRTHCTQWTHPPRPGRPPRRMASPARTAWRPRTRGRVRWQLPRPGVHSPRPEWWSCSPSSAWSLARCPSPPKPR
mmetsp:Transcript_4877/g.20879  ORF Transcript_4877/g.20879 Transcript_4877/m.20879 type:complete len:225 (-) Transcript_4877:1238-1912(-)